MNCIFTLNHSIQRVRCISLLQVRCGIKVFRRVQNGQPFPKFELPKPFPLPLKEGMPFPLPPKELPFPLPLKDAALPLPLPLEVAPPVRFVNALPGVDPPLPKPKEFDSLALSELVVVVVGLACPLGALVLDHGLPLLPYYCQLCSARF